MAAYGPPKELFDAFNLGKSKMSLPIPSLTGGSSGPALSDSSSNPVFGSVSTGFKLGVWGAVAVTVVSFVIVAYLVKK